MKTQTTKGSHGKVAKAEEAVTAKLFRNGRSQAVRLPKEFRFEGNSVLIRRVEKGVLLEPVKKKVTREEIEAWFAKMDSYGADDLFPDGRNQGLTEPRKIFD